MKKITLMLCTSIILSSLVACGNTEENRDNAANSDESANMDQVAHQTNDPDDFTVDDRVNRDEHEGSRNKTDGRGTFWFNNPQDVTDKGSFTEEERKAEEERDYKYESGGGQAERIEKEINARDDVEEGYVIVEDHRVTVAIQPKGDDIDETIAAIEEQLQDDIEDKELIITDDMDNIEQLREMREDHSS